MSGYDGGVILLKFYKQKAIIFQTKNPITRRDCNGLRNFCLVSLQKKWKWNEEGRYSCYQWSPE